MKAYELVGGRPLTVSERWTPSVQQYTRNAVPPTAMSMGLTLLESSDEITALADSVTAAS